MSFWGELKRRNVVKVGIAYLVAAWVVLQVVDVVAPILELPNWISRAVLLLLAVGFLIALILAWAYELTPQGILRDKDVGEIDSTTNDATYKPGLYVAAAIVLIAVGAGSYWYAGSDKRWALNTGLQEINTHIAVGDWESAFELAGRVNEVIPGNQDLAALWEYFSYTTTIPSDPPGATVWRQPYDNPDAEWEVLGETPLVNIRLPYGFSVLRIEFEGREPLHRVVGTQIVRYKDIPVIERTMPNYAFAMPETYRLPIAGSTPENYQWVSGVDLEFEGEKFVFEDYYIGKYEVTNEEFEAFVDAGGYEREDWWQHEIVVNGETVAWSDAMQLFVDRTGRPGPATWEGGRYPEGTGNHPVGGVSWYEASAFARFAGRELPTVYHWRKAFSLALLPSALPKSNLQASGSVPAGQSAAISHVGAFDMLGNVREWVHNEVGDQRAIMGAGWNDDFYLVEESISDPGSLPPIDRSATNGFRLAFTLDSSEDLALAREAIEPEQPPDLAPATNEVFEIYRAAYDYDSLPLDAVTESTNDLGDWRRETITFNTAYNDERITLYLDIPNDGNAPFQTILFWPGSGALYLDTVEIAQHQLEFLLKDGRAVAYPVLAGTFQRRLEEPPSWSTVAGRDLTVQEIKDFRRTIDYLETRPDIDRENLGYFGASWGGRLGALVLAIEPRIKAAVLDQAGFNFQVREEIRSVHYLPRVSQPILQFNGRYDSDFRYDTHAKPYFDLLGTSENDKKWVVEDTGHFVSRPTVIGETLDWFDKYLGRPLR